MLSLASSARSFPRRHLMLLSSEGEAGRAGAAVVDAVRVRGALVAAVRVAEHALRQVRLAAPGHARGGVAVRVDAAEDAAMAGDLPAAPPGARVGVADAVGALQARCALVVIGACLL